MKTRTAIVRAISLLAVQGTLLTTACNDSDHIIHPPDVIIHGDGNLVEETRPIGSFSRIDLEGIGTLHIRQGAQEELRVRAEANLMDYLKTEVHGEELLIWKKSATLLNTRTIEYHLTVVDLERVALSGAGEIRGSDLDVGSLALRRTGIGSIYISNLSATRLEVETDGVGETILSGTVQQQDIELAGLGGYNGRDLASVEADVYLTHGATATVRVSDHLRATIRGAGSVRYIGDPVVESDITGFGEVIKIAD